MKSLDRELSGVSAGEADCADCLKVWLLRDVEYSPPVSPGSAYRARESGRCGVLKFIAGR